MAMHAFAETDAPQLSATMQFTITVTDVNGHTTTLRTAQQLERIAVA